MPLRPTAVIAALLVATATACGGGGEGGPTYAVSGVVTPAAAGAGTVVTLGGRTAVADASGAWRLTGVAAGTYTATPSRAATTFTPPSRTVVVGAADVAGVDFAATATFTLSGTIRAAGGQRVDVDTADPNTAGGNNDGAATAQAVPSAVTVGGWASASLDTLDYYRATLAAGQVITLVIADPDPATNDLDLCLATAAAPTVAVACSEGLGSTEAVDVPAGADYLVIVIAAGAPGTESNYVLTVGAAPTAAAALPGALRSDREFVPGEVLVRFKDSALSASAAGDTLQARAAALGLRPLGGAGRGRHALLGLPSGAEARAASLAALGAPPRAAGAFFPVDGLEAARQDTLRLVKALRRRADVQSADPNYVFHPSAVPADEFYKFQWHYPLIDLPQAWDVTTGTPVTGSVVVAVIDTGVFLGHPDFAGQLVAGYDFIADPTRARDGDGIDANPDDPGDAATAGSSSWHGTHVAGTIAASSNQSGTGSGAAGVSWGAKVMPIRALGAGGGTSHDIIQGLRFAARLSNDSGTLPPKAADVVNLSLGCLGCFSQTEQDAYVAVRAAGLIVVAAAGNENSTTNGYPASYPGVVSVSAVDMALARAPYSNRGPNVDVAAPGGDTSQDRDGNGYVDGVLSALVDDSVPGLANRQPIWSFYQGTSMAAPHVAGVVALMKAVCPTLTPPQLDLLLASGAMTRDLGVAGRDDVYGHGLVDALGAVQAAQQQCGAAQAGGLEVTPGRVDFAPGAGPVTLTVGWSLATGQRAVTGVTDDATWLEVAAGAVDGNGYGPYTLTATTTGLASGRYAASVTFTVAGGAQVSVPVSLQVGAAAASGDAGYLYVLLVDPSLTTLAQAQGRGTAGDYAWTFTGVPAGDYLVVAGTDSDDDGLICDAGEACGAWPTIGVPTVVTVTGADVAGLDFLAGFEVSLGAASTHRALPTSGFRRLAPPKALEVRP
jgi:serine protease